MLFEKEGKDKAQEETVRQKDEQYKQIGPLQVENDYLKKYKQLYRTDPKW